MRLGMVALVICQLSLAGHVGSPKSKRANAPTNPQQQSYFIGADNALDVRDFEEGKEIVIYLTSDT